MASRIVCQHAIARTGVRMTAKELIAELQDIHEDVEVCFDSVDGLREVNAVNVETIGIRGGQKLVVILTDEN